MLSVQGLIKIYRKRRVVDGVSLEVRPGEVVGLLGKNGAGKTTTFRMTLGLIDPDGGDVFLDGKRITRMPMYRRARMGISFLPQEPSIFRPLTVRENILAVLETQKLRRKDRLRRLGELLDEFDLGRLGDSKAQNLSGGERRRLEITRALVIEPKIFLLDEPFAALDPIVVSEIQAVVRRLRERGIGILLTDHSVRETLQVTDRSYIINDGRILVHGSSADLIRDPEARRVYLGESFAMAEIEVRRLDQTRSIGAYETGLAYLKSGNFDAAILSLARVTESNGPDPALRRARAACHLVRREFPEALVETALAVQGDPGGALSQYYRGLALYASGEAASALEAFARARELDPALPIPTKFAAAGAGIDRADLLDPEG